MTTVAFLNRFSREIHEKIRDLGASFSLPERPLEVIFGYTVRAFTPA